MALEGAWEVIYPYDKLVIFQMLYYDGVPVTTLLEEIPELYATISDDPEMQKIDPSKLAYVPREHINKDSGLPPRAYTMFSSWPVERETLPLVQSVVLEFDTEKPAPGLGWWFPEASFQWTTNEVATLNLPLATDRSYAIEFRIVASMAPDILDSLTLSVNGEPITLTHHQDAVGVTIFYGTIPRSALGSAANTTMTSLEFAVNRVVSPQSLGISEDVRTLGIAFDWLRIRQIDG